jgi:hypothetical protein
MLRDRGEAEDVVQEIFLRLCPKSNTLGSAKATNLAGLASDKFGHPAWRGTRRVGPARRAMRLAGDRALELRSQREQGSRALGNVPEMSAEKENCAPWLG